MIYHKDSIAEKARQVLSTLGTASVAQIAVELNLDTKEERRSVGQALGSDVGKGSVERVGRGVYRWVGDNIQTPTRKSAPNSTTPDDLRPLVDNLDDEAFDLVDLQYVARTQDGGFICTDRNGVAWKIEVVVSARMM